MQNHTRRRTRRRQRLVDHHAAWGLLCVPFRLIVLAPSEPRDSQPQPALNGDDLAIRWNNCAANGTCPVCGVRTDPQKGPELFVRGTGEVVCRACGRRLNPALMATLDEVRESPLWPHHGRLHGTDELPWKRDPTSGATRTG